MPIYGSWLNAILSPTPKISPWPISSPTSAVSDLRLSNYRYLRATESVFPDYIVDFFRFAGKEDFHPLKQDLERLRRGGDDSEPAGSVLCRKENVDGFDLLHVLKQLSLKKELSPDAFIHCCRVRHSAKARKQTRI